MKTYKKLEHYSGIDPTLLKGQLGLTLAALVMGDAICARLLTLWLQNWLMYARYSFLPILGGSPRTATSPTLSPTLSCFLTPRLCKTGIHF